MFCCSVYLPVDGDIIVIEDSEDGYTKKLVQIGNLPGGGGSGTDELVRISATDTTASYLEDKILEYLKSHDGVMAYCDKSSPEAIRNEFQTSKNYFKNALGGLMKKKLIRQDKEHTYLL